MDRMKISILLLLLGLVAPKIMKLNLVAFQETETHVITKTTDIVQNNKEVESYLQDKQLITEIALGTQKRDATIDITTQLSWIQSNNPFDYVNCIGCTAKNDELFSCENGCTLLDSKRDPAREIVSFGGRVLGKGYLAKDHATVCGNQISNFKFAQIFEIQNGTNFVLTPAILGLAYGSSQKNYYNSFFSQDGLQQVTNPLLDEIVNPIKQISKISKLSSSFNIKIEDNLKLLTIGSYEPYFKIEDFTYYQNQGEDKWILNVLQMKIGDNLITTNKFNSLSVEIQQSKLVFDTTTRFIWVNQFVQSQFLSHLESKECSTAEFNSTIICNCKNINQFPKVEFKFNTLKNHTIFFDSKDYTEKIGEGKCSLLFRAFPKDFNYDRVINKQKNLIVFGLPFFSKYFAVFDEDINSILIAQQYVVNPDQLSVDQNSQIGFIIAGALIFTIGLAALLIILRQLGHVPIVLPSEKYFGTKKEVELPEVFSRFEKEIQQRKELEQSQQQQQQQIQFAPQFVGQPIQSSVFQSPMQYNQLGQPAPPYVVGRR